MSQSVYDPKETDDEKLVSNANGNSDDMGVPQHQKDQEVTNLEDAYNNPGSGINDQKDSPAGSSPLENSDSSKDFYNPQIKSNSRLGSATISTFKNKKLLALILGPLALIILLLFMMSALKIPNYAANIATYRFARSAMDYARTASEIDGTKVAVDSADDSKYKGLKDKYSNLRGATWGKLDKYRPGVMYNNLKATGTLEYETKQVKRLGVTTQKTTALVVNGERIALTDQSKLSKYFTPSSGNYKASAELQANISKALRGSNTLVRSQVAKKIRLDLGIKLRFWERAAVEYRGLTADKADQKLLQDASKKITTRPTGVALTPVVEDGKNAINESVDKCIEKPDCAKQLASGIIPDEISTTLTNATTESSLVKAVGVVSPVYAVALPACLIYEGSINHSGDAIDAQSASATKSFYSLASAKEQNEIGDTSAEAVAAFNRKLGSGESVPDQYLSGRTPDTTIEKSPQASATGDYTVIDALSPSTEIASFINTFAEPVCPKLTNIGVNIGVAVGSLVIGFFTGGTATIGQQAATNGVKQITNVILKNAFNATLKRVVTKEGIKANVGFAKKFTRDFIAIEGITVLSKMLVLSKAGLVNDGATSSGADFINQADMGANLHNNQIEQQMMYGAPLTNSATAAVDGESVKLLAAQEKLSPGIQKYFGITSPLTKIYRNTSISVNKAKTDGLASIASILSFNNLVSTLVPQQAALADNASGSNYGIVQWGWTAEETALIDSDPSYDVLENESVVLSADNQKNVESIESEYAACFTDSMGTLLESGAISRNESGDVLLNDSKCSPKSLGIQNDKYGENMVMRWRLYKKRVAVLEHNLGIQTPTQDETTANQCTDPSAANKNIFMVGDSLSVGMVNSGNLETKLKSAGWNPTVKRETGQSISWGKQQILDNKDAVAQAGTVIVELGTNDGNAADFTDRISNLYDTITTINPSAKIYWVNYIGAQRSKDFQEMSAKLSEFAQAKNITVINWAAIGEPFITADTAMGIHPYNNYGDLADLVISSIQTAAGCSSASAQGWVWPIKKEDLGRWSSIKNNESSGAGLNQCWAHYHKKDDGSDGYHAAIDIDVTNKPVYAAVDGVVVRKSDDGYNTLVIKSNSSPAYYAVYMHMSARSVSQGDTVTAGQTIGQSGEVGAPGAPHLHFGISTSNERFGTYDDPWATVNPLDFLPNNYSPALLKDDSTGSCLTKDIYGKQDFAIPDLYKTNNGSDSRYY